MKEFKLAQPQNLAQVTSLPSDQRYFFLAGGTDLLDEIKNEIIDPDVVVDLKSIPDLAYITSTQEGVRIGSMTRVSELAAAPTIKTSYPVLHEAALSLATPQLRNVATVGGNLCQRPRCWYYRDPQVECRKKGGSRCYASGGRNRYHAILGGGICYIVNPSDLAPALISLDAEVTIATAKGDKTLTLEEFYTLPRVNIKQENILRPNEILKEIKIPPPKNEGRSTYVKLKERGTWDFAVASVAVSGTVLGNVFTDIKIVLGGVAPIPWRLEKTEKSLKGKSVTEDLVKRAAIEALSDARPLEENAYKQDLAATVVTRAVLSLV
ncbi:MAG TPA: xanthine dehydrogenase family protein subunit M [Candidatus Heimdallarchaeota archaeon]|nr:xanthine dehydrogenase family protein subunit M [Candidatus Heimdallarchaeota archaeon]